MKHVGLSGGRNSQIRTSKRKARENLAESPKKTAENGGGRAHRVLPRGGGSGQRLVGVAPVRASQKD